MFRRPQQELQITISNRTILRIIAFGVATYAVFSFFDSIRHPLTLIFISFFLALALNPAVSFVTRKLKSKSRIRGTAAAYIVVMSLLIGFVALVVPPIVKQSSSFVRDVPNKITNLETQDSALGRFVRKYDLSKQLNKVADEWASNLGNTSGPVLSTANRVLSVVVSFITVLVLTFMMLVEGPAWVSRFILQLPKPRQKNTKHLMMRMYGMVTSFVNAQVLIALIAGCFAIIALSIASNIFNVSINPIALGAIVIVFGIIPTIGNIIAAVVVCLACLFTSGPLAIAMLIYFIIYQQIENATVQPYIQSRSNDLSPMLIFIAAIVGIGFGGLLGGFIAIPAAGCIKILVDNYLDDKSTVEDNN